MKANLVRSRSTPTMTEYWTNRSITTVCSRRRLIVKNPFFQYTIMMHTTILTATILLFTASPVHAYVTPEQVLQQTQYGTYVPDPEEGGDFYAAPEEEEPMESGIHYVPPHGTYRIQESQGPHSTLQKYKPAAPVEEEADEETILDEEVRP